MWSALWILCIAIFPGYVISQSPNVTASEPASSTHGNQITLQPSSQLTVNLDPASSSHRNSLLSMLLTTTAILDQTLPINNPVTTTVTIATTNLSAGHLMSSSTKVIDIFSSSQVETFSIASFTSTESRFENTKSLTNTFLLSSLNLASSSSSIGPVTLDTESLEIKPTSTSVFVSPSTFLQTVTPTKETQTQSLDSSQHQSFSSLPLATESVVPVVTWSSSSNSQVEQFSITSFTSSESRFENTETFTNIFLVSSVHLASSSTSFGPVTMDTKSMEIKPTSASVFVSPSTNLQTVTSTKETETTGSLVLLTESTVPVVELRSSSSQVEKFSITSVASSESRLENKESLINTFILSSLHLTSSSASIGPVTMETKSLEIKPTSMSVFVSPSTSLQTVTSTKETQTQSLDFSQYQSFSSMSSATESSVPVVEWKSSQVEQFSITSIASSESHFENKESFTNTFLLSSLVSSSASIGPVSMGTNSMEIKPTSASMFISPSTYLQTVTSTKETQTQSLDSSQHQSFSSSDITTGSGPVVEWRSFLPDLTEPTQVASSTMITVSSTDHVPLTHSVLASVFSPSIQNSSVTQIPPTSTIMPLSSSSFQEISSSSVSDKYSTSERSTVLASSSLGSDIYSPGNDSSASINISPINDTLTTTMVMSTPTFVFENVSSRTDMLLTPYTNFSQIFATSVITDSTELSTLLTVSQTLTPGGVVTFDSSTIVEQTLTVLNSSEYQLTQTTNISLETLNISSVLFSDSVITSSVLPTNVLLTSVMPSLSVLPESTQGLMTSSMATVSSITGSQNFSNSSLSIMPSRSQFSDALMTSISSYLENNSSSINLSFSVSYNLSEILPTKTIQSSQFTGSSTVAMVTSSYQIETLQILSNASDYKTLPTDSIQPPVSDMSWNGTFQTLTKIFSENFSMPLDMSSSSVFHDIETLNLSSSSSQEMSIMTSSEFISTTFHSVTSSISASFATSTALNQTGILPSSESSLVQTLMTSSDLVLATVTSSKFVVNETTLVSDLFTAASLIIPTSVSSANASSVTGVDMSTSQNGSQSNMTVPVSETSHGSSMTTLTPEVTTKLISSLFETQSNVTTVQPTSTVDTVFTSEITLSVINGTVIVSSTSVTMVTTQFSDATPVLSVNSSLVQSSVETSSSALSAEIVPTSVLAVPSTVSLENTTDILSTVSLVSSGVPPTNTTTSLPVETLVPTSVLVMSSTVILENATQSLSTVPVMSSMTSVPPTNTTSSLPPTTSPPATTTQNLVDMYWVKTIIKVPLLENVSTTEFETKMETRLIQVYNMAFDRQKKIAAGTYIPLKKKRRKRYTKIGDTAVDIHETTRSSGNVSMAYTVEKAGSIVPASEVVTTFGVVIDQEVAIILRYVVVSKAETYKTSGYDDTGSTTEASNLWIIGVVLGGIVLIIIVVWVILCVVVKKHRASEKGEKVEEPRLLRMKSPPGEEGNSGFDGNRTNPKYLEELAERGDNSKYQIQSPKRQTYEVNSEYPEEPEYAQVKKVKSSSPEKIPYGKSHTSLPGSSDNENMSEDTGLITSPPKSKKSTKKKKKKPPDYFENDEVIVKTIHPVSQMQPRHDLVHENVQYSAQEEEELKKRKDQERKKNKQRIREKKKREKKGENNEDFMKEYLASQEEIDNVLEAPPKDGLPDVFKDKSSKSSPEKSKEKSQTNEGYVDDESLQQARQKMHKLLDDAFALISPSASMDARPNSASRRSSSVSLLNQSTTDTGNSPDKEGKKHEPLYINPPNYRLGEEPGLATWSPYRASDEVALISMPLKMQTTSLGNEKKQHSKRPVALFSDSGQKGPEILTSDTPQPIVLKTRQLMSDRVNEAKKGDYHRRQSQAAPKVNLIKHTQNGLESESAGLSNMKSSTIGGGDKNKSLASSILQTRKTSQKSGKSLEMSTLNGDLMHKRASTHHEPLQVVPDGIDETDIVSRNVNSSELPKTTIQSIRNELQSTSLSTSKRPTRKSSGTLADIA